MTDLVLEELEPIRTRIEPRVASVGPGVTWPSIYERDNASKPDEHLTVVGSLLTG